MNQEIVTCLRAWKQWLDSQSGTPTVPFSNTSTSMHAADKINKSGNAMRQIDRVLHALENSKLGMTDEQIAGATGIGIRQASTRRNALVRMGKVQDSGKRMRNANGCQQIIWVRMDGKPQMPKSQQVGRIAAALSRQQDRILEIVADEFAKRDMALVGQYFVQDVRKRLTEPQ